MAFLFIYGSEAGVIGESKRIIGEKQANIVEGSSSRRKIEPKAEFDS